MSRQKTGLYSEAVTCKARDHFIRFLENAFWYFGGVVFTTLVIDNLWAAGTHASWYDLDLNSKVQSFGEHYGTVILPIESDTPA